MKSSSVRCLLAVAVFTLIAPASRAQVLIASNGFESGDNWAIASQAGTASITNIAGASDTPANQRIRSGTQSWQLTAHTGSRTGIVDLAAYSGLDSYTGKQVVVHVSSISSNSGNGADAGDNIQLFVTTNDTIFFATPDIRVHGNSNARWGWWATNFVRTPLGVAVSNAAPQANTSTNNYGTLYVDLPDSATSVAVRVRIFNDASNEIWCVDDIQLWRDVQITSSVTNTPPVLAVIGDKSIVDGGTLSFTVTASDLTDNDIITLSASNLPGTATFATTSAATQVTNTFEWVGTTPVGVYTTTFFAADDDGTNVETITITVTSTPVAITNRQPIWINEIHYDDGTNVPSDEGEGVEIAGPEGTVLSNYYLLAYNGSGNTVYDSNTLSGAIDAELCGYGAVWFPIAGLQNGDPDGLALVQKSPSTVLQFISYGGAMVAANGAAAGFVSTDIVVKESNGVPEGFSLQLQGSGTNYYDFTWAGPTNANSTGSLNTAIGQLINPCSTGFPPTLAAIGSKFVVASGTLSFAVTADDLTDGNEITLYASNLPAGATFPGFTNATSVTSSFDWVNANPPGIYTATVYAADVNGIDSEDVVITVTSSPNFVVGSPTVWINEFHYDNVGGDTDEFVEVAGPESTDLANYHLLIYNAGGAVSASNSLVGDVDDEGCGYGAVAFTNIEPPNTGPIGLALVDGGGVIQFISYEGVLTATNGAALGFTSTDIGVSENASPTNMTLQLQGAGTNYTQFTWAGPTNLATIGSLNAPIQTISPCGGNDDDSDLLPNDWEAFYFGGDSTAAQAGVDYDLDGFDTLSEYIAGTHPTNGASFFELVNFSNVAGRVIYLDTVTGRIYGLDYSSNLLDGAGWTVITGAVPGIGGSLIITDEVSGASRSYRGAVKLP